MVTCEVPLFIMSQPPQLAWLLLVLVPIVGHIHIVYAHDFGNFKEKMFVRPGKFNATLVKRIYEAARIVTHFFGRTIPGRPSTVTKSDEEFFLVCRSREFR